MISNDMKALILRNHETLTVAVDGDSAKRRDELLAQCREIKSVGDEIDMDAAYSLIRSLDSMIDSVEECRVAVKFPLLDATRKLDAAARGFSTPLAAEKSRLSSMIVRWQQKLREELERAARAKAEAERAAALAAEQARKIEQAAASQAERSKAVEAAKQAASAAASLPVVAPVVKPDGMRTRTTWHFSITDANALYGAHPEFCEVTLKARVVQAAITAGMRTCPGLNIWAVQSVS